MITNAMILGGSGEAGSLLVRSLLQDGVTVTAVDLHSAVESSSPVRYLQADVTNLGPELAQAISQSDCICICLPEQVALDSAPRLAAAMADGALWVDTLSVKGPIAKVLESYQERIEILSINPMFAPALGWNGRPVAVVESGRSGPKAQHFKALLTEWGASIETVSAEEHDRLTAALQVATHAAALAFGSALLGLNYNVKAALQLATPPHRILLGLLYRMISQNPEVYWDIQAYHPHAADVRRRLGNALDGMQSLAAQNDLDGFKRLFRNVQAVLAPSDDELARLAQHLIASTQRLQ